MDLAINKISDQDISSLHEIETLTGLAFWGAESYKLLLSNEEFVCSLMARITRDGTQTNVGFVIARFIRNETEIMKIAVHPDFQRLGIGGQLLDLVIHESKARRCKVCYLEVRESNTKAMEFYTRHRFEVFGYRKNYYTNPTEDACVMRRVIP